MSKGWSGDKRRHQASEKGLKSSNGFTQVEPKQRDHKVGFTQNDKGMFFPAKYKYLSDIVSLVNPDEAKGSVKRLKDKFDSGGCQVKKRIRKSAVLAMNRARAMMKQKRLSDKERNEYEVIARIYEKFVEDNPFPDHCRKSK